MKTGEVVLITRFDGEYEFLSNFSSSPIKIEGVEFPTVEHAFQAMKTLDITERLMIAAEPTPGRAKRAGRKIALRADWEKVKEEYMYNCLRKKFSIPEFKEKLLATGDAYIIEGNTWGDRTWGVCDGEGRNLLGQLLMRVRTELREQENK